MTSRVIISLRTRRSWSDGNPVTVRPSETPGQPPRHPAAREHDVDVDDDRHHTTSSSSRRSIVALRNRDPHDHHQQCERRPADGHASADQDESGRVIDLAHVRTVQQR
jgi:hypothetical protein